MRVWSVSTTVRNPERFRDFLKTLKKIEGKIWNNLTQKKYQVLLLQDKAYGFGEPQFMNPLTEEQKEWLYSPAITYEQAENIVDSKNYVGGAEMRGRQSLNPLKKLGLAYINSENKVIISQLGNTLLADDYDLGSVFFRSFLKWQYPNPDGDGYSASDSYNVKPLIATFHVINRVNEICKTQGLKQKGISKVEFAMFISTLSNYNNIENTANNIVDFRNQYESIPGKTDKDAFAATYFEKNFSDYGKWDSVQDFTDNTIRCFRMTR
ncbi:MAG: hypothetical protein Ta2A_13240 [Treponemataceae bacterium]|nr:MAG: hypothetical protein Ta2A_13240 [Treponemataceae bacterium]